MAFCVSLCFGTFLLLSLLLYLGEIILNAMFVHQVLQAKHHKDWFVPLTGLLLLPMVTVQLVSAVLLLLKKGDKLSTCSSVVIAVFHILQLGFVWRHVALFREKDPVLKVQDLMDLSVLQILHTFSSMLPLLLIQTYMLFHYGNSDWLILATICVTLAAICWFLASFRRHHTSDSTETIVMTWPGTIFRLLWRAGEITSRVISLAVFASVYFYWIFLILGLHWLTMLVCLCTSILGMFDNQGLSKGYKFFFGLLISYMYSFCFVNFSSKNSAFRYTLYYVIMFLENAVLTAVWYLHSNQPDNGTLINTITFISASAFFIGVISLIMYYRFFHVKTPQADEKENLCVSDGCINCRLSLCSKHNIKLQRPFSAGWISQYQQALVHGNYYKNIMQDSFIDTLSDWDTVSSALSSDESASQNRHLRDGEAAGKQYNSIHASGTYAHKRFFDSSHDLTCDSDTDTASIMDADGSQWYQVGNDQHELSTFSDPTPRSVCSSQTHLLTDSWDSLLQDNPNLGANGQAKKLDIVSSLIRKDIDSGMFSDGYSTDHTLDSYQLPVTVLAKRRQRYHRRGHPSPPSTYSTASDSTDCTICAFMRQYHSHSPVSSMRSGRVYENIPEEASIDMKGPRSDVTIIDTRNKRSHRTRAYSDHNKTVVKLDRNGEIQAYKEPVYAVVSKVHKSKRQPIHTSEKKSRVNRTAEKSVVDTSLTYASDSGDSAFPRSTPLSSYLAATDDDEDGASEAGCEMII